MTGRRGRRYTNLQLFRRARVLGTPPTLDTARVSFCPASRCRSWLSLPRWRGCLARCVVQGGQDEFAHLSTSTTIRASVFLVGLMARSIAIGTAGDRVRALI